MNKKIQDVVSRRGETSSGEKLHERKEKKFFISICCYSCDARDACSLGNSVDFFGIESLAAAKGQGELM